MWSKRSSVPIHLLASLILSATLAGCRMSETASFVFKTVSSDGNPPGAGSSDHDESDDNEKDTPINYQKFAAVMKKNCNACHVGGVGGATSWFSSKPKMQNWRALAFSGSSRIKPRNADESNFMIRIRSSDPDVKMPPSGLSAEDQQIVANWINSLEAEPNPEPSSTEPPSPPPPTYGNEGPPSTFTTRVMDRKAMYDWFLVRFGPSVGSFAKANILGRPSRFGGACSSQFSFETGTTPHCEDTLTLDGVQLIMPSVPDPDLGREGLRTKTCREALFTPGAAARLYHALRSLPEFRGKDDGEIRSYLANAAVPTQEQLRAMYKIFYGYREPGPALLGHLRELAEASNSTAVTVVNAPVYIDRRHEPWRYVLLALCYGADNQFL